MPSALFAALSRPARQTRAQRADRRPIAVRRPAAVHLGPADPISGAHVLPRIREVVPRAKLAVLDEAPAVGHFPQVEAPELVGPLLVRRLAGD